ncbi:MAG: hypothetical protein ABF298_01905, partial [Alteriqipengyuania sp.]
MKTPRQDYCRGAFRSAGGTLRLGLPRGQTKDRPVFRRSKPALRCFRIVYAFINSGINLNDQQRL